MKYFIDYEALVYNMPECKGFEFLDHKFVAHHVSAEDSKFIVPNNDILKANFSFQSCCLTYSDHHTSYITVQKNDFETLYPEIAQEWHPIKNHTLSPHTLGPKSNIPVWWLGKCGHEWRAKVADRTKGQGCPYCSNHQILEGYNDLQTLNPALAEEWHPVKNDGITPKMVSHKSNKKVWWLGKCGHEWQAIINNRSKGRGCPYCANKKVLAGFNDLATLNPMIAAEWHPSKNGNITPYMVTANSGRKVWWQGKCGHEWETRISHRNNGSGCPYCAGQKQK